MATEGSFRQGLHNWLTLPSLGDEVLDTKARALYAIQLVILGICIFALVALLTVENYTSASGVAAGLALLLLEIYLLRRKRFETSATSMLLTMPIVAGYLQWVGRGLSDVSILIHPMLILLAALLLSPRPFLAVTSFALLSLGSVIAGHLAGRLDPRGMTPEEIVIDGLLAMLLTGAAALAGYILSRNIRNYVGRARESEERYRRLVSLAPIGIFTTSPEGKVLFANQHFAQILDRQSPQEVVGTDAGELFKESEERRRFARQMVEEGRIDEREVLIVTPAGNDKVFQLSAYRDHVAISGLATDVTARHRAERDRLQLEGQLRQSQKMEAIGALAGGIAHDFNNILASILGNSELAMLDLPPNHPSATSIAEILKACDRAKQLVARIMTFSRRAENSPVSCDPALIVKEAARFLRSTLPAGIEIREQHAAVGDVVVDPTRLHQVVMNLGTNAYHAMQAQGGVLEISCADLVLDDSEAKAMALPPGPYARITVSDTGTGIPQDIIGRIFEPYFTTKEADKGTGLGLSVVHGIVTAAGGTIRVYSEEGHGATFSIYLPSTPRQTGAAPHHESEPLRGSERVLLVDDESMIAATVSKGLETLGYRVTAMVNPEEALARFRAAPEQFDVVITDLAMPKLNGEDITRAVLDLRPEIPVILCTGGSESLTAERVRTVGVRAVLRKPVSRAQLSRAIRDAVQAKA